MSTATSLQYPSPRKGLRGGLMGLLRSPRLYENLAIAVFAVSAVIGVGYLGVVGLLMVDLPSYGEAAPTFVVRTFTGLLSALTLAAGCMALCVGVALAISANRRREAMERQVVELLTEIRDSLNE